MSGSPLQSESDYAGAPAGPGRSFVIIDDDVLLREMLRQVLMKRFRPRSVELFGEGTSGLAHCLATAPDLVLVDLLMPGMDGRELLRELRRRGGRSRVIVLTGVVSANLPAELIALGVNGYVDKQEGLKAVEQAVKQVLEGGIFYQGQTAAAAGPVISMAGSGTPGPTAARLTDREIEVARAVAAGASSKEVAARLGLSVRTVEGYRAQILAKTGLRDTAGLVRWCIEHGLG